jgi:hypothetical protein
MQLRLRLRQRRQGVDAEQKLAGFFFVHVENLHINFPVGIEVAAEVAVDELGWTDFISAAR